MAGETVDVNIAFPAAIACAGVIASAIIGAYSARRKSQSSEQATYYRDIRSDVDNLRSRVELLEGYVTDLETHIDELNRLMVAAGLQPPPRPKRPRR